MVVSMEDAAVIDNEELRSSHMRAQEVLSGPERRRRWSVEEKLRILAQSVAPGSSVSLVCRLHKIKSGQLYTWRRLFRSGELTGFCAGDGDRRFADAAACGSRAHCRSNAVKRDDGPKIRRATCDTTPEHPTAGR
jgi:hypothetical protein